MLRRRVLIVSAMAIASFWLVMMLLLLRREVFTPFFHSEKQSFAIPAEATDTWLGLSLIDKEKTPIGYVNIRSEPERRDGSAGVKMRVMGRMHINLGSFQGELVVNGDAWATPHDGLKDFSFAMRSGEHATTLSAQIENGHVTGVIDTGGEKTPIDLTADSTRMLTTAPGFGALNMPKLDVNQEILVETFDPITMSTGKARVRCVGDEYMQVMGKSVKTKIYLTDLSGIKSKAWVDEDGNVLRAETPLGFVLQRMSADEAIKLAVPKGGEESGLLELAAVQPDGATPIRGAKRMRLELTGLQGIAQIPQDDSQSSDENGKLLIEPKGPSDTPSSRSQESLDDALANDAFLQIDNPKIVAKAAEIVGNETDPWKKAMRIYEWVHASIKKNIVPSLPTSLDVLNTLEGDCNEHTILFTALARASGIPTRMAIGLVWSDEFNGYYYHAWPEVYAGRWVWVEPTLGQPIADATHIKLISGDLMSWWRIAPFMGNIKLHVLEVQ